MEPDRWRRVEEMFFAGLELDAAGRAELLAGADGEDPELAREVAAMLSAHHAGEGQGIERFLLAGEDVREPADPSEAGSPTRVGAQVGAYRLVELIGRGGMGEVYLAERADGEFQQVVAIKLLRAGFDNARAVARFRAEREILARLEHPHIARLLDGGVTGEGLPFLAMESVRGELITRFCGARKLPIEDRLRLFLDICRAVHFAHRSLVVHRDLKPSNILVSERGEVKLLDFGIAKLLEEEAGEAATRTGLLLLTPEYASPEQVRGGGITTATDVYALGLLLYEILTGKRAQPVEDLSPAGIARAVCDQAPELPSAAVPERRARRLRGDLDTIVATALHKDPARRYASAERLADDVLRHLEGRPIQARADSFGYRTGKFLRRHRLAAAASATVVAALLVGLLLATSGLVRARRAEAEARREAETARQVSELLIGIFKVSDPGEARGETVTARELLDRGAERVREQLADQPEVQGSLLRTIGHAYSELGLYERAEGIYETDLAVRRSLHGEEHPEVAESLTQLAEVANRRGQFPRAGSLALRALDIQERTPGLEPLATARALSAAGIADWQLGNLDSARARLERSLAMKEKVLGSSHPDLAGMFNNVAILRWQAGDLEGARPLYERALKMLEGLHGERHPTVAATLNNLALVESQAGRLDQARALHERALAIRRVVFAPDHPDIGESLNNLGNVLIHTDELALARSTLEQALAIRERTLGPEHPLVGATLCNLGLVLAKLGDAERARPPLERSVEILSRAHGPDHPEVSAPLQALAALHRLAGDLAAADRLSARVLALRGGPSGRRSPSLESAIALRVRVLRDLGREEEAAALEEKQSRGEEPR
jgi:eukaryotic-like serine/threonine-protein kinase